MPPLIRCINALSPARSQNVKEMRHVQSALKKVQRAVVHQSDSVLTAALQPSLADRHAVTQLPKIAKPSGTIRIQYIHSSHNRSVSAAHNHNKGKSNPEAPILAVRQNSPPLQPPRRTCPDPCITVASYATRAAAVNTPRYSPLLAPLASTNVLTHDGSHASHAIAHELRSDGHQERCFVLAWRHERIVDLVDFSTGISAQVAARVLGVTINITAKKVTRDFQRSVLSIPA